MYTRQMYKNTSFYFHELLLFVRFRSRDKKSSFNRISDQAKSIDITSYHIKQIGQKTFLLLVLLVTRSSILLSFPKAYAFKAFFYSYLAKKVFLVLLDTNKRYDQNHHAWVLSQNWLVWLCAYNISLVCELLLFSQQN